MADKISPRLRMAWALVVVGATAAWAAGSWHPTSPMTFGRWAPTATRLTDGSVLVAGGYDGIQTVPSAQLFHPPSGLFLETAPMLIGRNFAEAVLLNNGKVLVAGGFNDVLGSLSEAELYEPLTDAFRTTLGRMNSARELFTATKLPNGKVLLVGGFRTGLGGGTLRTAEVYDPAAESFKSTGSLQTPYGRFGHAAVLLGNTGKVLIVGGKERRSNTDWRALNTAEVYDIASGKFTLTKSMAYRRDRPTVAWIASAGKALVIGGKSEAPGLTPSDVRPSEWFDPATNAFSKGPSLSVGRMAHGQAVLGDGSVLVTGGWNTSLNRTTETAERFMPSTKSFTSAGSMADSRHDAGVALLQDGRVLVAGGKKVDQNPGGSTEYLYQGETYLP